jgi:hypothetical protein
MEGIMTTSLFNHFGADDRPYRAALALLARVAGYRKIIHLFPLDRMDKDEVEPTK